ncbi:aldehyde dehydrogenase family protein [Citricoccus sp. SGAir0253]|uniref:aldehyde dehydrogenase family protein n=1 Tax=Citricoccus sp. SGAir0253 TaxID=2567881 RepID=UPI0010CD108D|nr:aldehyde dehydrogenase family protein [Citricoccus sp. SGAir0253]QCU77018.1 aldehyde dehydrogenase family protein [Citricoccus sp. SGAir0253]
MITEAPPTVLLRHLVAGSWEEGTGAPLVSANPARPHEEVAHGLQATASDVDRAMAAASAAARDWARTPMHERGAVLARAAGALERRADELGLELAREEGKTLAEGTGEVLRAAQVLRYYGAAGDRAAGEVFASPRRGERILVTRRPLGVVGVITPFNFPIAIPAWKIAPALAYGNTVVWKPASTVPLLAVRLAEALQEGGLPAGVLNLLIGPGQLGAALVEHPGLDGLTFTGSTGVGRRLAAAAAARGVPMQAEMGGKNAAVVLADADLDLAAEQVLLGAFRSTGQKCTATSRLVVDEAVAGAFLDRLRARLDRWTVGDPTDAATHMGPLVSESAAEAVREGIRTALREGAALLHEGQGPDGGAASACFVPPTVLEVPAGPAGTANTAWREEFFGPVLTVVRAAGAEEAFALANDSEFGLSAAVFTQDVSRVLDAVDEIDVGILHVNSESAGADPHVPFGGAKRSGYGPKEQGGAAQEFFTHTTTVYLRGGTPA